MEDLLKWRSRHHDFKIELLKLSNKIEMAKDSEDIVFYQELCEMYARHLKKIEAACYKKSGIQLCTCSFNPEQCSL